MGDAAQVRRSAEPGFLPAQENISEEQGCVSSERHIFTALSVFSKKKKKRQFCFVENNYFFSSLELITFVWEGSSVIPTENLEVLVRLLLIFSMRHGLIFVYLLPSSLFDGKILILLTVGRAVKNKIRSCSRYCCTYRRHISSGLKTDESTKKIAPEGHEWSFCLQSH